MKTRSVSEIRTWDDAVRIFWETAADIFYYVCGLFITGADTFYYVCGFFITRSDIFLRVRISYYGCGYFIKGADNFMLAST